MARTLVAALALTMLMPACRRVDGPAEAYRAFAEAARAGDVTAVWERLSERSRETLDARAKALAGRTPAGVVPASGRDLVLGDLARAAPRVEKVLVVRESADVAVVAVTAAGAAAAAEVSLVREGGAWRVVLPPLSSPAP
jgi:histidinol-phosphate/aromatic aminotransferase/cobyric acid decarboxylase-like protein